MRYRRMRQSGATYFFTVVTFERKPLFGDPVTVALLHDVTRRVATQHPFQIEAEVILPDHIHVLWTLPDGDADFSTRWMLIKSGFSRRHRLAVKARAIDTKQRKVAQPGLQGLHQDNMSRQSRGERTVWQPRFWEHLIRDERDLIAHIEYIHFNPVKHGLVRSAIDWPHSTFKSFVEQGFYDAYWGSSDMPPLPVWAGKE